MRDIDMVNPEYDSVARQYALMATVKAATGLDSKITLPPGMGLLMVTYVDGLQAGDRGRVYHSWVNFHPNGTLDGTIEFFADPDDPSQDYVFVADPGDPATPAEWAAALNDHYASLLPPSARS